jgi:hypothetical protein
VGVLFLGSAVFFGLTEIEDVIVEIPMQETFVFPAKSRLFAFSVYSSILLANTGVHYAWYGATGFAAVKSKIAVIKVSTRTAQLVKKISPMRVVETSLGKARSATLGNRVLRKTTSSQRRLLAESTGDILEQVSESAAGRKE